MTADMSSVVHPYHEGSKGYPPPALASALIKGRPTSIVRVQGIAVLKKIDDFHFNLEMTCTTASSRVNYFFDGVTATLPREEFVQVQLRQQAGRTGAVQVQSTSR